MVGWPAWCYDLAMSKENDQPNQDSLGDEMRAWENMPNVGLEKLFLEPPDEESARLKQESDAAIEAAVARMKDLGVRRFFSEAEWRTLATYDGPIVSGDPAGVTKKDKPA